MPRKPNAGASKGKEPVVAFTVNLGGAKQMSLRYFEGEDVIAGKHKYRQTSLLRDSTKMHFHAVGLTKKIKSVKEVEPSIVDHVCHIKPAESIVTEFEFEIYLSNAIKKHGEFTPKYRGKHVGHLIDD